MRTTLVCIFVIITHHLFAQVTITGVAKNTDDSAIIFLRVGFHEITRERQEKRYAAPIDKHGKFSITLPEHSIGRWVMESPGFQLFDLVKGQNITLDADFAEKKPLKAIGKNAADFNYYDYVREQMDIFYNNNPKIDDKATSIADALQYRKNIAQHKITLLSAYKTKNKMSEKYYKWLQAQNQYAPYERTYVENVVVHTKTMDDADIKLLVPVNMNDDYAAIYCSEYTDLINMYMHYAFNKRTFPLKTTEFFNFGCGNILKGLTKEVFLTQQIIVLSKSKNEIYAPVYKKYIEAVNNKSLIAFVDAARKKYLSELELSNKSPENISKSQSLTEIFNKYKGKVVYVDFWASWCGPCRAEMPHAAKLKERLKDKDVVFVYLGYNDSKENWLAARADLNIAGDHYLLSDQLIKEANKLFGIAGIPHYVIIDKEGNIVEKKADRPGNVYDQLTRLLK